MIDIHCHLMAGIDDGAEDLDESRSMIELAKKEGIKEIIVTPHYSSRLKIYYDEKFKEVQEITQKEGVMLHRGCEYKLQDALTNKNDLITLAGSDFVLVEITTGILAEYVLNQIYQLKLNGYEVIIAHPERSFEKKDMEKLKKLAQMNVYFQLTAASFVGIFGKKIQKFSQELLESGLCHFIASDAHDVGARGFYFAEFCKLTARRYMDDNLCSILLENNQKTIINGQDQIELISPAKKSFLFKIFNI